MKNAPFISRPALWLLLSIVSAVSMAHYVTTIWSANQPPAFSDLYAPWWASHELLLHRRNPYSPAIAHEIQTVIYGAPVASSPDDPNGIAGGFAYPPYAALVFWPVIHTSFSAAQKIFVGTSLVLTLLSLALWLSAFRFRLPLVQWLAVALFVFGSFPALQALKLQNPSLVAAAFIAITLFFLSKGRLVLAGIFLAGSTFKPQFVMALVPWLAIWMATEWRHRRSMAWSFLATLISLGLISEWLAPGWIASFLNVVRSYRHYTYGHSLFDVWLRPPLSILAAAALLLAALGLSWRYRSLPADSLGFLSTTSFMLAVNLVVIPTLAPHAQLLLLPGLLCLLFHPAYPGSMSSFSRLTRGSVWILLAWPWIAVFALLLAALAYPAASLVRFWQLPLYTSPILPLAVALALGALLVGGRDCEHLAGA
jgi:hypothetical protein